jgi:hypothetical protein
MLRLPMLLAALLLMGGCAEQSAESGTADEARTMLTRAVAAIRADQDREGPRFPRLSFLTAPEGAVDLSKYVTRWLHCTRTCCGNCARPLLPGLNPRFLPIDRKFRRR